MPIYEYKCPDCGVFEERHSMATFPRVSVCPECQADAPKIISAVNTARLSSAAGAAMDFAQSTSEKPAVVSSPRSGLGAASKPANITQNPQHRFLPTP